MIFSDLDSVENSDPDPTSQIVSDSDFFNGASCLTAAVTSGQAFRKTAGLVTVTNLIFLHYTFYTLLCR